MKYLLLIAVALIMFVIYVSTATADTIMNNYNAEMGPGVTGTFPNLCGHSGNPTNNEAAEQPEPAVAQAIWPFSKKDDSGSSELKPKSSRKAFFLSFLLPGLGEAYVGSKRGLLFLGIEVAAWWMYTTNTNKGKDIEDDYQRFANLHWHYYDKTHSQEGQELDFNYWEWLLYHFREVRSTLENEWKDPDLINNLAPYNYALIDSLLKRTVELSYSSITGHSVHNLPSKKTQQYYEMIGKYPQFIYGWEDIDNPELNPTIRQEDGIKYDEDISIIKSRLRNEYENLRDDSNKKLKAGQRGVYLMLLNRVFSAIDAARLAYHHNKKLDSELSMVRIRFAEKYIIDNNVPMIMLTKKF